MHSPISNRVQREIHRLSGPNQSASDDTDRVGKYEMPVLPAQKTTFEESLAVCGQFHEAHTRCNNPPIQIRIPFRVVQQSSGGGDSNCSIASIVQGMLFLFAAWFPVRTHTRRCRSLHLRNSIFFVHVERMFAVLDSVYGEIAFPYDNE